MWHKSIEQLPEVGRDVIFNTPNQSIDVGWLDDGKDNGLHCFVGRAFGYDVIQNIKEEEEYKENAREAFKYAIKDLDENEDWCFTVVDLHN